MFKNLTAFQIDIPNTSDFLSSLNGKLSKYQHAPLGEFELKNAGWAPIREEGDLFYEYQSYALLNLAVEKRSVPKSVIVKKVKELAADFENENGYAPGRKQVKKLAEEALELLIPRAFPITKYTRVILDLKKGLVLVDSVSTPVVDEVVKALLKTDDTIQLTSLDFAVSATDLMARWLLDGPPTGITIDDSAVFVGAAKRTVTLKNVNIDGEPEVDSARPVDAGELIQNGMHPSALAITITDDLSSIFTTDAGLKSIKFNTLSTEAPSDSGTFDTDLYLNGMLLSKAVKFLQACANAGDLI